MSNCCEVILRLCGQKGKRHQVHFVARIGEDHYSASLVLFSSFLFHDNEWRFNRARETLT